MSGKYRFTIVFLPLTVSVVYISVGFGDSRLLGCVSGLARVVFPVDVAKAVPRSEETRSFEKPATFKETTSR